MANNKKTDRVDRDSLEPADRFVLVERDLRTIKFIGYIVIGIMGLVLVPGGILLGLTADKSSQNSTKIKDQEKKDTILIRDAAWRNCARDNLVRADQHVTQDSVIKNPMVIKLFTKEIIQQAIERRNETIPVLNCDPNFCGTRPIPLRPNQQRIFLDKYKQGLLQAIPDPPPTAAVKLVNCPIDPEKLTLQLRMSPNKK